MQTPIARRAGARRVRGTMPGLALTVLAAVATVGPAADLAALPFSPPQEPTAPPAAGSTAEAPADAGGADDHALCAELAAELPWRMIGPGNMGGRVTDIEITDPRGATWYVATAGGGLWKTDNAGTTWQHLFRDHATVSIGDVAVAPSDPSIVWIGSGEENARNSVSWGDGVYKSTDGGKTFRHVGLTETFQIGHVAIHPQNPDVVFVAALGALWGPNPDRGVYRTTDGGETWARVLYLDDRTGCIDVRIDPENPSIVYACMYERMRDGFDSNDPAVRFGAKAGLFRSTDGGDTWTQLTAGLPTVPWGRSGLTVYAKDPKTLYLIVETERSGWATGDSQLPQNDAPQGNAYMGVSGQDPEKGEGALVTRITDGGPGDEAGLQAGDVIVRIGDKDIATYAELIETIRSQQGGEKAELKVRRGGEELDIEITWGTRRGAANTGRGGGGAPFAGRLGGQQPNIQKQQGDNGFQTGGVFRSDDRGDTWKRVNSLTDRPFYYSVIAVDPSNDQNVWSVGVPLYASFDGGAKFEEVQRRTHVDYHALWIDPHDSDHVLVGGDGGLYVTFDRAATWQHIGNLSIGQFYNCDVDNQDPYFVYGGLQDNGTWRGPSRTRWREGIGPDDWVTIYGGDGFRARIDPEDPDVVYATSQNGGVGRLDMGSGRQFRIDRPRGSEFNWNTPFFLSPHNPRIFYLAGDRALRSLDRGGRAETISEELGLTERGTATAFVESPRVPGLLYVGTDDGALRRTDDGGREWTTLHDKVIGLAGPRYVSSIEPSHHADDRVYVGFDGHRSNDFTTYVLVSEDRGKTWRSLADGLPKGQPVRVVKEDPRNADLLFVGTEFGLFVSHDRGAHWHEFGDLPTVAVHDLAIQNRDQDLVAATHGNGLFIADLSTLRQVDAEVRKQAVHLFQPERATLWNLRSNYVMGHREWWADNPEFGAPIQLWTREAPGSDAQVEIRDLAGELVAALPVANQAGLHLLNWDLRRGGDRRRALVAPGTYAVSFGAGDARQVRALIVRADPDGSRTPLSAPVPTPDASPVNATGN